MILHLKKHLTKIWIFSTFVAVIYYVNSNFDLTKDIIQKLNYLTIISVAVFVFLSKISSYILTSWFIKKNTNGLNNITLMIFASINQVMKYIPGGIWHYLNRFLMYKKNFEKKKKGFLSNFKNLLFEILIFTITGFILIYFSYFQSFAYLKIFSFSSFLVIHIFAFLLLLIASYYFFKIYFKKVSLAEILFTYSLGIIMHLAISYSLFIMFNYFEVNLSFFNVVLVNSVSTIIGYYVFFAPGGIGARELCFVYLLFFINQEGTLVPYLLILHRLIIIFTEILIFLLFYLSNFISSKNKNLTL